MDNLDSVIKFCNDRIDVNKIKDFPGAWNGLQVENNGEITKIGAAVDAGLFPFQIATEKEIDFLIVHHGLFWSPPTPLTGASYEKIASRFLIASYRLSNDHFLISPSMPRLKIIITEQNLEILLF